MQSELSLSGGLPESNVRGQFHHFRRTGQRDEVRVLRERCLNHKRASHWTLLSAVGRRGEVCVKGEVTPDHVRSQL